MFSLEKKFININIKAPMSGSSFGTRDTVAIIFEEGSSTLGNKTISSYSEANTYYPSTTYPCLNEALKLFFNNGGVKALCIGPYVFSSATTANTVELIKEIDNEVIAIGFVGKAATTVDAIATAVKAIATAFNADTDFYGINEKLFISVADDGTTGVEHQIYKYGGGSGTTKTSIVGTVLGFLSAIDIENNDSIVDYCFTNETVANTYVANATTADDLLEQNINVDTMFAGSIRNIGGNTVTGKSIVNEYIRIILHQFMTDAVANVLVQNIKNETGINQIYAAIAGCLEQFISSGYIVTDKIYTGSTITVTYNNRTYTIIQSNTILSKGYDIVILPLSSLTDADRNAHKAPPIYVVYADQYAIRAITINGTVI